MIVYIPSSAAEPLSDALWALTRPSEERGPQDTRYMFTWVQDSNNVRWLVVDTEFSIRVHEDAELGGVETILQDWVNSGHLQPSDITNLQSFIDANRGQNIVVYDAFPAYFKSLAVTQLPLDARSPQAFSIHS